MSIAVVAEKPSVARDIAAVLGAVTRGDGCFHGAGYVVTWALGHLVALAQPHQINPAWKQWNLATLPMLPKAFPLVVIAENQAQFTVVKRILTDRAVSRVVCATDAGREGELIFRHLYEATGCRKPVNRLWISSLTPDAIRRGFANLKSAAEYDRLADAARGRSRADWLVGMNLSRAYTLTLNQDISVGRVQTPTLAMVVERELSIRNFVPEDYVEVVATFAFVGSSEHSPTTTYQGVWFRAVVPEGRSQERGSPRSAEPYRVATANPEAKRLAADGKEAAAIVARTKRGDAAIESVRAESRRLPPPLLYDLTELQRHANRLYGMSAQTTLDVAQSLYERHKLLSYPRTDSRCLSQDVARTLSAVVDAIADRYPVGVTTDAGSRPLGRRFVDDARVTDHHAIIPTSTRARENALNPAEKKIYDLVCRRLLQAWHAEYVYSVTTLVTAITTHAPQPIIDHFESRGTSVEQLGWKVLDIDTGKKKTSRSKRGRDAGDDGSDDSDLDDQTLPAGLGTGQRVHVDDAVAVNKRTRPPKHYTEATLLTAMEHAGRTLDEKELSDALRDLGLGTPATRAQIIETLLRREYMLRSAKSLRATDKGIKLISVVHPEVKSPSMTGEWEAKLKQLQRGQGDLETFMSGIEAYVTSVVGLVSNGSRATSTSVASLQIPKASLATTASQGSLTNHEASLASLARATKPSHDVGSRTAAASENCVQAQPVRAHAPIHHATIRHARSAAKTPDDLRSLLQCSFGFADFRPHQAEVCHAAAAGHDLLLVMPTGAGKSLCYQLPGIARGGTTLVISPLIALMEDQAAKLCARGFRAERIHSGRSRSESRKICQDYLTGQLDFLFVAPERLRVPGFPEMLAKRTPALIAVDEAHCISQWGHDFRPEYRMLGQRLPALRPAPILALTATATPRVQDDIVQQLGLQQAERFIHGFRRDNIAISVVEMSPKERCGAIRALLSDGTRRPAIVYAATRKSAEELGAALGTKLAAVYHAGIEPDERERIQNAFLDGRLEVVVATVAFGMGIDKADVRTVIHAALPGSLEGYYQEIGRAGRDGRAASAILMHSFVDRKTHEFFHQRDYPDPEVLDAIHAKLSHTPIDAEKLRRKLRMKRDELDKALEKLCIHGGAQWVGDEGIIRGAPTWHPAYVTQRDHRLQQLTQMLRFATSLDCRMLHMIRHFGDQEDDQAPCGLCDVCAPDASPARHLSEAAANQTTGNEQAACTRIVHTLAKYGDLATGRLYREAFADNEIDRRSFEHLLKDLCRAGLVSVEKTTFVKDEREITYLRASLTSTGRQASATPAAVSLPTIVRRRPRSSTSARSASEQAAFIEPASPHARTRTRAKTGTKTKTKTKTKAKTKTTASNRWFFINRAKRAKKGIPSP